MFWATWWVWAVGALALAIFEIFAPGFIFLGFALGAAVVALIFLIGGVIAAPLAGSVSMTVLAFAVASLLAWIILRRVVGVRGGQVKIIEKDIND